MMHHFTGQNFDQEVLKSDMPVLVDFFAEWCGPCKFLAPIIEKLAKEYDGKVKMGKLDIDQENEIAGKYDIQAIPTIIIFKNGEVVAKETGFKSEDYIRNILNTL